jgi:hypothetical protein
MATAKGPLYSETAQGTIEETLVFSTGNGFQRVQAKKLKYPKVKHRYFDNQTFVAWSGYLIRKWPEIIESVYKPLAEQARIPVQAYLMLRLKSCNRQQKGFIFPTNTYGSTPTSGSFGWDYYFTPKRLTVSTRNNLPAGYDAWIVTMGNNSANSLNRTQLAGYVSAGVWTTQGWITGRTYYISTLAIDNTRGLVRTNTVWRLMRT